MTLKYKQGRRSYKPRTVTSMHSTGYAVDYSVHNNSINNAFRGAVERIFLVESKAGFTEPPQPEAQIFDTLQLFKKLVVSGVRQASRIDRAQFPEYYTGRKKRCYLKALERLETRGLRRSDAYLTTFVKAEKVNFTAKPDPAPRLIQPRKSEYILELGTYLKPVEHDIYRSIDRVFGAPVVAKGKNAIERAKMLERAWREFDSPVAIPLDASRFDQHISADALRFEHSFYLGIFNNDPYLMKLLNWQIENKGFIRTLDGEIKYDVYGSRMSGDINTALGNVVIMCALMWGFLNENSTKFRLIDDGDDSVVIVEKREHAKVMDACIPWFRKFGFTMKVGSPAFHFEGIEFCQCQPVMTSRGWIMCRDPRVCIDKDLISVVPIKDGPELQSKLAALGDCGLALAGDVPVLGEFYSYLSRHGAHKRLSNSSKRRDKNERAPTSGMEYWAIGLSKCYNQPTEESRYSFYKAFGITPDQQLALEDHYRRALLWIDIPQRLIENNKIFKTEGQLLKRNY